MGWFKSKNRYADTKMSEYVRLRSLGLCEVNLKCHKGTMGSQASHFQKRRKETVRFDPFNVDWVCGKCHYYIENHPDGQRVYEEFKKKQLGEKAYNLLILRANTPGHKDDKLALIYIKKLKDELINQKEY